MYSVLTKRVFLAITYIACTLLLGGCMAPLVVGAAAGVGQGVMLVGSGQENKFVVTIDEKTFTPKVRDTLLTAKHWAMATEDEGDAKIGDVLETRGGFRVSPQRLPKKIREMMVSERREALGVMCSTVKSDIAMLVQSTTKETGTLMQAFMGRSHHQLTGTVYVLTCRGKVHQTFDFAVSTDTGEYAAQSPAELNEAINKEYANQLLLALGK